MLPDDRFAFRPPRPVYPELVEGPVPSPAMAGSRGLPACPACPEHVEGSEQSESEGGPACPEPAEGSGAEGRLSKGQRNAKSISTLRPLRLYGEPLIVKGIGTEFRQLP